MGEREMRGAFWAQAHNMMASVPKAPPQAVVTRAGAELELFLFHPDGSLATKGEKRQIMDEIGAGYELGASIIELHPKPVNLAEVGFSGWFAQLWQREALLRKTVAQHGLRVGRCGTIPWADTRGVERTDAPKYRAVPDFHDQCRPQGCPTHIGGVFVGEAGVVGLINAFQFSLQTASGPDAVDKLNRLLAISPAAVALSANASVLDCQNTGWADVRYEVWRLSHETRNNTELESGRLLRIGLPRDYYKDLGCYLEDVASYPFILDNRPEAALAIGIGLFWRDARIKCLGGKLVVEFRPLSTQPTLIEDLALAVFTIGRLLWSQLEEEELLPMEVVRENKHRAEKYGIDATFLCTEGEEPAQSTLRKELARAQSGLEDAGLLDNIVRQAITLLELRIETGWTPSKTHTHELSTEALMELVCS